MDRSLKTFLHVSMISMLLLGSLRPATAWAQLETAAAEAEPPLDEPTMKALIHRVRAGDDAAIAEFEKVYTSVTQGLTDNSAQALADDSVEDQNMVGAYIMLSLAEARGSRNARTIRDMLFEEEKFEKLAYAQNIIGERLDEGDGIPEDDALAVKWYRLAADQGDATAQANLGWQYHDGEGAPKDTVEAVNWFRLSALKGNAFGEFALAQMYDYGIGIGEDDVQAVHWYRLAAEQGIREAQNDLGVMYADGLGTPKDNVAALKWYRAAAMQNHSVAQLNLGRLYRDGEGVPEDPVVAYMWLTLAASENAEAREDIYALHMRMQPAQVAKARELARGLLTEICDCVRSE